MGVIYWGSCHDCKECIDLDKFYDFGECPKDTNELPNVDRTLRLFAFLKAHSGHRSRCGSKIRQSN